MYSTNQILQISGNLKHSEELSQALQYVLEKCGSVVGCYQITDDGKYVLGWGHYEPEAWTAYPTPPSIVELDRLIRNHLESQIVVEGEWDGDYYEGFLIKAVDRHIGMGSDGVKEPAYGIISIEPFTCFYSK